MVSFFKMQTKCTYSRFLQGKIKKTWLWCKICFFFRKKNKIESLTRCKLLIQNPTRCESFISKSENLKKFSFQSLLRWKVKFSKTVTRYFFWKVDVRVVHFKTANKKQDLSFLQAKESERAFLLHKLFQELIFWRKINWKSGTFWKSWCSIWRV